MSKLEVQQVGQLRGEGQLARGPAQGPQAVHV
jgi:hypothetical protein